MTWMIKLSNDTVVSSEEVTVAQLTLVAQTVESTAWAALDPMQSAQALVAWVALLEAQATGIDLNESVNKTMRLSVTDLQSRIRSD